MLCAPRFKIVTNLLWLTPEAGQSSALIKLGIIIIIITPGYLSDSHGDGNRPSNNAKESNGWTHTQRYCHSIFTEINRPPWFIGLFKTQYRCTLPVLLLFIQAYL